MVVCYHIYIVVITTASFFMYSKITPNILMVLISGMIFCKDKIISKVRSIEDINQITRIAIIVFSLLFKSSSISVLLVSSLIAFVLRQTVSDVLHQR